jgi:hypothetical protein
MANALTVRGLDGNSTVRGSAGYTIRGAPPVSVSLRRKMMGLGIGLLLLALL